jgi:DNA-directed RNA polymerase specialized sigma24 family protein
MGNSDHFASSTKNRSQFPSTHWTVVLLAQTGEEREAALEKICQRYWYPIYAFLRKSGRQPADAEDLTQGFFQRILGDDSILRVDSERGKLRTFLLANLKRHLSADQIRKRAVKRGGGAAVLSIDQAGAEARYLENFVDEGSDPDLLFGRIWASDLFRAVIERLSERYADSGRSELFEALRASLTGASATATYAELSERLVMPEATLRSHVNRLRKAFRAELEEEISLTLADGEDIRSEMKHLASLLRL